MDGLEVLTVSKGSVNSTQRITNDDREHDGGDGDIKPVLLHDEVKKREQTRAIGVRMSTMTPTCTQLAASPWRMPCHKPPSVVNWVCAAALVASKWR